MAEVKGIGGVFFKCRDRKALCAWYAEHLGLEISEHGAVDFPVAELPPDAWTVWGPFKAETRYFEPSDKPFMINFIVDDLEGVLERAERGGAERVGGIEDYEYGRFGWFLDPEGNKVELWQPPAAE